jgi:hypothetical protein
MRFEARELKAYAEPVAPNELKENEVYFSVEYMDDELLIPRLEPMVFIGRNLKPGETGLLYFQDIDSFRDGYRFNSIKNPADATFFCVEEQDVPLYKYQRALDLLLACSLRRRDLGLE